MKTEELLALLQEKGLSDDEIAALLKETLETLHKDDYDHDEDEKEEDEEEVKKASELLGVEL